MNSAIAIQTKGLRKVFNGKTEALRPLDLEVSVGSCFGLLGPNGAGKSTLVKTLLSIVYPTSGEARLLGRDIRDREARRGVGFLPEGHSFPPYLDGRGVCRYFGRLAGLRGAELEREIDDKLRIVDMADRGNVRISRCSKGMKQRIGLAQAMLGDPKLIFLDEPTDGVDPQGRAEIRGVITDLAAHGTTVFLNSHLLSEVEQICDRVAILDKGTLLRQGTVKEIVRGSEKASFEVRFRVAEVSLDLRASLERDGAAFVDAGEFTIQVRHADETSAVIDRIRAAGVAVYAVEPKRTSLEDAFINLVTEKEGPEA